MFDFYFINLSIQIRSLAAGSKSWTYLKRQLVFEFISIYIYVDYLFYTDAVALW